MKTRTLLLSFLPLALSSEFPISVLKGDSPIYLGDVFWPPSMTFLAWVPSPQNTPEEWCTRAADASNELEFSLEGMNNLKIHDYFKNQAYITWDGRKFANCYITPESTKLGSCAGVLDFETAGGRRFMGPGNRKWACWVVGIDELEENEAANLTGQPELTEWGVEEKLTDATLSSTLVKGAALSSSIIGAFTAAVTAM
jgi:hypothetical protein